MMSNEPKHKAYVSNSDNHAIIAFPVFLSTSVRNKKKSTQKHNNIKRSLNYG